MEDSISELMTLSKTIKVETEARVAVAVSRVLSARENSIFVITVEDVAMEIIKIFMEVLFQELFLKVFLMISLAHFAP